MTEPRFDVAPAFRLLGKRWNGLLLSVLLSGPAGYAELKRSVPGISDSMLSDRLAELTDTGLCERAVSRGHRSPSPTGSRCPGAPSARRSRR